MKIYLATSNKHKLEEIALALAPYKIKVEMLNVRKLEIQSKSIEEIATRAVENLEVADSPIAVEDSGLFIDALNGFPGPYSHYVYETIGIKGVLKLLEEEACRSATFVSVIALKTPGEQVILFKGETRGIIAYEPKGTGGFGFDPVFIPEGSTKTFAEMTAEEKNLFSHRGKAVKKMAEWIIGKTNFVSK